LIVEAVAHHHHPERVPFEKLDLISSLYFANCIANEREAQNASGDASACAALNEEIVKKLGVANKLDDWRLLAEAPLPQMQGA
jgi:hypothetical protein